MPAGQGQDAAERFAAAVELGRTPGLHDDDDDLAREVEIVAMLRSRGAAYAPPPDAKARAKQRLMAALAEQNVGGAPARSTATPVSAVSSLSPSERTTPLGRVVGPEEAADAGALTAGLARVGAPEQDTELAPVTELARRGARRTGRTGRTGRHTMPARTRRSAPTPGLGRRVGLVGSAALLVMVAFTGAGVFVSRDALPGDTLYGIKRTAEAAGLAMTFDDEARARRNLELAAIRLGEVEQLVARGDQAGLDPQLLRSTMLEFEAAASEGSRTLLADEQIAESGGIEDLRAWAAKQGARLSVLRSALPVPAQADNSIALLDRLRGRTEALESRSSCSEVTSGAVDDIGPLPAEGSCAPRPADPAVEDDVDVLREGAPTSPGDSGPTNGTGTPSDTTAPGSEPVDSARLGPNGVPLTTDPDADPTTTKAPPDDPSDHRSVPAPAPKPLEPPVLPPLMPGMPPLTVG